MEAHVAAENHHDLDAIMATFSNDAELIFNSNRSRGYEEIGRGHALIGMSSQHALPRRSTSSSRPSTTTTERWKAGAGTGGTCSR
jgi:hypothetical protein